MLMDDLVELLQPYATVLFLIASMYTVVTLVLGFFKYRTLAKRLDENLWLSVPSIFSTAISIANYFIADHIFAGIMLLLFGSFSVVIGSIYALCKGFVYVRSKIPDPEQE